MDQEAFATRVKTAILPVLNEVGLEFADSAVVEVISRERTLHVKFQNGMRLALCIFHRQD